MMRVLNFVSQMVSAVIARKAVGLTKQSTLKFIKWIATPTQWARNDDLFACSLPFKGALLLAITFLLQNPCLAFEETKKFEEYLNSIKTLSGDFTQVNSRGRTLSGTIQISRPGKMRLEYNPPSPLLIVSDGKWLINYDKDADEVTYLTMEKTPAAFILRPKIKFSGDVEITSVIPEEDSTAVTLIRTSDPDEGYITLVFQNEPVSLIGWSVTDSGGVETRVFLSNMKSDVNLPAELFKITSPNLIQQIF